MKDLNYFGCLFESLVVRDLRVYAQHVDASVFHYRDNIGEVDVVIDDGIRWGALEVKLGVTYLEEAATSLKRFVERVDTEHRGQPASLGVVGDSLPSSPTTKVQIQTHMGRGRGDDRRIVPRQPADRLSSPIGARQRRAPG